jgi:hypothetical protein
MASPTDVRLIAQVELIAQKSAFTALLAIIWFTYVSLACSPDLRDVGSIEWASKS